MFGITTHKCSRTFNIDYYIYEKSTYVAVYCFSLHVRFKELYHVISQQEDSALLFDIFALLYVHQIVTEVKYVRDDTFSDIITQLKLHIDTEPKTRLEAPISSCVEELHHLQEYITFRNDDTIDGILQLNVWELLPKIASYYCDGLEKKFQSVETASDINDVSALYTEKTGIIFSLLSRVHTILHTMEVYFGTSFGQVLNNAKKMILSLEEYTMRRQHEFLQYLSTIKANQLYEESRVFVSEKISESSQLINEYQDNIALITRQGFPELHQVETLIDEYTTKIGTIKTEVQHHITHSEISEENRYRISNYWEAHITVTDKKLEFFLSSLLSKLHKMVVRLQEKEDDMFDMSINSQTQPISTMKNYTEDELHERATLLRSKINGLTTRLTYYQEELTAIEQERTRRIKTKEGIGEGSVQCAVCRQEVMVGTEQFIKCYYCEGIFHYMCIASWISTHNSCPTCQNEFLDPHSPLFEHYPH